MSRSELQEVQALLERILPDPSGFAGRLVNQAMGSVYRSGYSSLMTSEKSSSASELSFTSAHGLPSTSCAFSSKRAHSPSRSRRSSKSATRGSAQ